MRTCERCGSDDAENVGGEYGTEEFERFCNDCWETVEFEYEEHEREVRKEEAKS